MRIPRAITNLIESFERLPGIGPKTAQRLAFYLLFVPQVDLDEFANNLIRLKNATVLCKTCFNIGENEICDICADSNRDKGTVCVIEDPLDAVAIERSGKYKGVYHVLHGIIDPLNNMGPNDIYIPQLIERIKNSESGIKEIIIATNPTMEGEATAIYITREIKSKSSKIKITRIARGLPTGADLEYADEVTIDRALAGRIEY